jgi:hypothetical protein
MVFLGWYLVHFSDDSQIATILLQFYIARGLTSLFLMFSPSMEVFVVLVFLKGLGNLGAMPSELVLLRSILTKDQIVSNAGIMASIDQITKVCAPLIGALMAQWFKPSAGFSISAVLAIFGLLLLSSLNAGKRYIANNTDDKHRNSKLNALILLIKGEAIFRCAFFASFVQSVVLGLYDPLLALVLKKQGFPVGTFGTIVSCTAAGAIFATIVFRRTFLVQGGLRLIAFSLGGFGMTVVIPGLLVFSRVDFSLYWMFGLWLANDACYGLAAMSFGVVLQTRCPIDRIGTVSASARSAQLLAMVIGPLIGASIAKITSREAVFVLCGAVALAGAMQLLYKLHPTSGEQDAA